MNQSPAKQEKLLPESDQEFNNSIGEENEKCDYKYGI
jgi:hypothetical protein